MKKLSAAMGVAATAFCLWSSDAEAATYAIKMPINYWTAPTGNPWITYGCPDILACITNYNESDDDSLDAGLFAKTAGQLVSYATPSALDAHPKIKDATSVHNVRLVSYMQASQGEACTILRAHAVDSSGSRITEQTYCDSPGPAQLRDFDILPVDGGSWTVSKLKAVTTMTLAAQRISPSGARHYLAQMYILVRISAP